MPPAKTLGKDEYPEFQYKPAHQFMRCHSHNDDPADGDTKVWSSLAVNMCTVRAYIFMVVNTRLIKNE